MHELVLRAPQALVEPVSDLLVDELGALSVSVEDADAGTAGEQALFGEPGLPPPAPGWERSTLKALFETEAQADAAAARLLARHGGDGLHLQALAALQEEDWVRLTQSQFGAVEITPDFWVVPSWHEPPAAARRVLRLDPGLAFGTGTHPTTRMCLRWLAARAVGEATPAPGTDEAGGAGAAARTQTAWPPERLLDYGCGSGILAIGAALLGARAIDAVDIDPAAVQATRDNAARNGVAVAAGTPEHAQGRYSIVLANILAKPLELLAPLLCGHVAPGGWLVLAGILDRQADELAAAYAPHLTLAVADRDDGWALMTAQRPPSG